MSGNLIIQIAAAINTRALYPANHPRVIQSVNQVLNALKALLEAGQTDSVTLLIVGDDLVFDQEVLRKESLSQRQFLQAMKRRGIERLTLAAGLEPAECDQFIAALATGETPQSSAHLIVGRVQVSFEEETARATETKRTELSQHQLDVVREAFAQFRRDKQLPFGEMEELVWSFIDSLSKTTQAILPLAKLKEHDEYTFVHSVNVSLLVLAQARSFGIQGSMLHAFGLAALLHDIGKLTVPHRVLNSPGKLEGEDWAVMQSHTDQGAWYLSEMEGSSPLSIVVAYEHHLRVDGQPNYPQLRTPRMPNLASRMTSVADTYDAMSTVRPYQQPLARAAAFEILRKRSGTFYDPLLAGNFIRIVTETTSPSA
jgi:HD-GYP domain-containing protein (c-di-GMP phosphodiesterase class II)